MTPLVIRAAGMVTAVGLNAAASCAAIRCGLNNFQETRFMDSGGEWIQGSEVPLEQPWRGLTKLIKIISPAIRECLDAVNESPDCIPLLLCVAEEDRPGRLSGLDTELLAGVRAELGVAFHPSSVIIPFGRVAGAMALKHARSLLDGERLSYCIVAGVDSYLVAPTLAAFEAQNRLLTSKNSNGFLAGEAGAAVLVCATSSSQDALICAGIGFGVEKATVMSEEPLRADGMAQAFKEAFADSGKTFADVDYRITDVNGEQYYFKEAALAMSRTMRVRKDEFDIWTPVDCLGEVGAAIGPSVLAIALAANRKNYAAGQGALAHFSNDSGERVALVLQRT